MCEKELASVVLAEWSATLGEEALTLEVLFAVLRKKIKIIINTHG
jgi:hypothetical protein